jgi:hypothetical protein
VTFYHFDVVEILISEEDFHMEIQDKIYYFGYVNHCIEAIIRGKVFLMEIDKKLH